MTNENLPEPNQTGIRSSSSLLLESDKKRIVGLHTFNTDARETIQKEDASLTRIYLAERKKQTQSEDDIAWGRVVTFGVLLLLIIGGSYYGYKWYHNQKNEEIVPVYHPEAIISYDSVIEVQSDSENLSQNILKKLLGLSNGNYYLEVKMLNGVLYDIQGLAKALEWTVPPLILANAKKEIMAGIVVESNNIIPYFLFQYADRNTILAGMQEWEASIGSIFFKTYSFGEVASLRFRDSNYNDIIIRHGSSSTTSIYYGIYEGNVMITNNRDLLISTLSNM